MENELRIGVGDRTGTFCANYIPIEIASDTIMERHLREELRIANYHLMKCREQLRELTSRPAQG